MALERLRQILFKLTPQIIKNIYRVDFPSYISEDNFSEISYSQEGEDLILKRLFSDKEKGFFVDVGAHHPQRFSNTYLFYKRGWRGINIDAMPGSMEAFDIIRPEDVNIECGISDRVENLTFYIFNENALNTFSEKEAYKKNGLRNYKIEKKITLKTRRLSEVLQMYLTPGQNIDFLTIDAEGYDLRVLNSIDWSGQKPKVILVEENNSNLENLENLGTYRLLKSKGYILIAKTFNTLIYKYEE